MLCYQPRDSSGQNNVVSVKASDFEVFEALAVDSIGTESAKTGDIFTQLLSVLRCAYVMFSASEDFCLTGAI